MIDPQEPIRPPEPNTREDLGRKATVYSVPPPRLTQVQEEGLLEPPPVHHAAALSLERASLSWRAIFAGTLVSLLVDSILMSLGLALGGSTLEGIIRGTSSAPSLGWAAGIWIAITTFIALFAGAYVAGRSSGLITGRLGRIQGVVISALFFGLMLSQVGATLGVIGRGAGNVVAGITTAGLNIAQNPKVQQVMDRALGGLNLRSPPDVVAQGVVTRVIQGDPIGARNYLASQAGISPAQAQARIDSVRTDVISTARDVGATAARGASIAGWVLFASLLLGTGFAVLGGGLGAQRTLEVPLSRQDRRAIEHRRVG